MISTFVIILAIAAAIVILIIKQKSINNSVKDSRASINPDFASDNIAVNSGTGQIWMRNSHDIRIVSKSEVQNYAHEWTAVNRGATVSSHTHHIIFTISDLKNPRFVVNFATPRTAKEWKQRLDVFFST